MKTVSIKEAKESLEQIMDDAQREPVLIQEGDKPVAVIVSERDYYRLRKLMKPELAAFSDRVAEGPRTQTYTQGDERFSAMEQLEKVAEECKEHDWDGYGAKPVTPEAVDRVKSFISALPEGFPAPDVSVEPDGEISLDWSSSGTKSLSVSIGSSDDLPYAWIDGADRGHGVVRSVDFAPPPRILEEISRLSTNGAAFRTS